MLRVLTLFMIIVSSNGCSWIARDYYFHNNGKNSEWTETFKPGQSSTKRSGYPDSMLFMLSGAHYEIRLRIAYQDVVLVGPLWFPIFPTFSNHDGDLLISSSFKTDIDATIGLESWLVTDLDTNLEYSPIRQGKSFVLKESTLFYLTYPVKAKNLQRIKLELGTFKIGNNIITPTALILTKIKGTWHFEQFTL